MTALVESSPSAEELEEVQLVEASADASTEAESSGSSAAPREPCAGKQAEEARQGGAADGIADLEAAEDDKSPIEVQARGLKSWAAWCRPRRMRLLGGVGSILVVALLALLFYPRDPIWNLTEMHMSPEVLDKFVAITTGAANSTEPLGFSASVHVHNPNLVGSKVDDSSFTLYYKGAAIGGGWHDPINVGGHADTTVQVYLNLTMPLEVGHQIMEDALADDFQIVIDADVKATAHAGPISVKAKIRCSVTANTMMMLEHPDQVLGGHECKYTYRL